MKPDEVRLIAHDPDALEAFYLEHVEAVQGFVIRRVHDPHLAADLTAEIFLAAMDASPGFRPTRGTPSAWLIGIAHNVVVAEHRRGARERRANERVEGRRLLDDDDILLLQERIDAGAASRQLFAALEDLPAAERAVLELTALDGLAPREAAVALGIPAVTARVRLHRARAALRRRLARKDTFDENDDRITRSKEAMP